MNAPPTLENWLLALGTLALQCTVLLALAGAAQTAWRSPRWRRVVWLAVWTALALVLGHSLAGFDRQIAGLRAPPARPTTQFIVRSNLPAGADAAFIVASAPGGRALEDAALPGPAAPPARSDGTWWPAWLWLAGSLLVAMWVTLPRVWLAVALRRSRGPLPLDGADRLRAIAERVGWRRPLRVLASPRLAGPIAFGVLRPGVAVPADFWARHTRAEQDVMLAHELAHLAARDPLWLALADALTVLLWWHPLVWWGRRQFRAASEAVADEASLVVEDGPALLAGCLVALASQWQRRGVLGLLGMAGFRSGLGRRVERLLHLKASAPGQPASSKGQRWQLALGSVAALTAAIVVPPWVLPMQAAQCPPLWAMLGAALTPAPAPKDTAAGFSLGSSDAIQVFPAASNTNVFANPSGKALFFDDRTGVLVVRATLAEIEALEPIQQGLNAPPLQITLEAKFVELTDDGSQDSPLERFLALLPMTTNGAALASSPFPGAAASGPNTSPGHVANPTGPPTPSQPGVMVLTQLPGGTNPVQELRGDQLTWPGRDVANAGNIKVTAVLGASLKGVLTEAQFREAMTALEGRAGVDILAAPKVTTLNGRQAQFQAVDLRTVVTGFYRNALKAPGAAQTMNGLPFTLAPIRVGPALDITPTVAADGHAIELTVVSTLTEFLSYDAPPAGARVEVQTGEGPKEVEVPLPRFRVRQMQAQAQIGNGQTLVLGGFPVEEVRRTKDKASEPDNIPFTGPFFHSKSPPSVRKTLWVFITATIKDPAGNRVHPAGRPGAVNARSPAGAEAP